MRRLLSATLAALLALTFAVVAAAADWPTTCIGANDAFEYSAGRFQNVGIYQRVFPNAAEAEAACQRDHRADIQAAFAWANDAPTPPPTPSPADPSTHPDYEQVRRVAFARGAPVEQAAQIAADVIGRRAVDAFLRGTDGEVQYGLHACEWQSGACPLAPEYVPPPEPQIDAALQPAWDLMASTWAGEILVTAERASTLKVRVGTRDEANVPGWYRPPTHTVYINALHLERERQSVIASILAHELYHAISKIPRDGGFGPCIAEEVWGHVIGALIWRELEGPNLWDLPSSTNSEANLTHVAYLADEDTGNGAAVDFDEHVLDWHEVMGFVLRNYTVFCTQFG